MILTLSEAADLKKEINDNFSVELHFHDGCGGQYFSLEKVDDKVKDYIIRYFSSKNMKAVFSDDGLNFTVQKN
ncbi:MAG: hypothetical protein ACI4IQ_06180 [Eubacterium sp.]